MADMRPIAGPRHRAPDGPRRQPLRLLTTTLWEYPSQHYDAWIDPATGELHRSKIRREEDAPRPMQGDKEYVGATPSWIIWQLLQRYTRPGDAVLDPMCGSGTTLDVCTDLGRNGIGFDVAPSRPDIKRADSRRIPLPDESVDFAFIDPPYSTHVDYSDQPACIGKLDALGDDDGDAYYAAMGEVLSECYRVLRNRRYLGLYVSDSFQKKKGFAPIGIELFGMMANAFMPVDIIAVVRHNAKLQRGNWHKAAIEGNFFLRGFNYLFIMKKQEEEPSDPPSPARPRS